MTTCPCGETVVPRTNKARDAARKFCSRSCAGRFGGGLTPPSKFCRRCGWAMDEANTYTGPGNRTRCRRCLLAAGRAEYVPTPKGAPRPKPATKAKPKTKPKPVPAPTPIRSEPEVPVWRPPGWAPVPQVRRVAS